MVASVWKLSFSCRSICILNLLKIYYLSFFSFLSPFLLYCLYPSSLLLFVIPFLPFSFFPSISSLCLSIPCCYWTFLAFWSFSPSFLFLAECFSLLQTDCIHCGNRCWLDPMNKSKQCPQKIQLRLQPKKKTFLPPAEDPRTESCSMSQADHGTGALYIIMDAINNAKAEREQEKQGREFKIKKM